MKQTASRWRTASLAVVTLFVLTATTARSPRAFAADPRPETVELQRPASPPGTSAASTATDSERSTKSRARDSYPFRGRIASLDTSARTLILEGKGTRRKVQLTEQTRILRDGSAITLEDLKAGDRVGGTLRKSASGQEEALLVRIVPPKEAANGDGGPETGARNSGSRGDKSVAGSP